MISKIQRHYFFPLISPHHILLALFEHLDREAARPRGEVPDAIGHFGGCEEGYCI
jgi:hypothetical protein